MSSQGISARALECPLCGLTEFAFRFIKQERAFYRCKCCQIERQAPLPTLQELQAYYDSSFQEGMYREFTSAQAMKQMTAACRAKHVARHLPLAGRWLDVGCADGVFVSHLVDKGVEAEGIELSQVAVSQGRARGLKLHCGTIEALPPGTEYDTISAFDVLEHVLEPVTFIQALRDRLTPGGSLVLSLPDTGALVRRLMGSRWYFYIPQEHLHYFNRRNLRAFLERQGLSVTYSGRAYKPLTFDYSLTQFAEYNPLIYRILNTMGTVIPKAVRNWIIPLPIGEMLIIAKKM